MSANPLKGEVALPPMDVAGFEAGGVMLLDFNALCSLEGELQEKVEQIGAAVLESPSMMRSVMRVALEDRHGVVEDRLVGKIIQTLGMDVAAEKILEAFTLSFPEAAKTGNADPRTGAVAPAGTGGTASKSGARSVKTPKRSGVKRRASSRV